MNITIKFICIDKPIINIDNATNIWLQDKELTLIYYNTNLKIYMFKYYPIGDIKSFEIS